MKLSKDIIYYQLSKRFSVRYLNDSDTKTEFMRPVFLTGKNDPSACVTIINSEDCESAGRQALNREILLICLGNAPERIHNLHIPAILVEGDATAEEVFNSVQEIFNTFDQWDDDLKTVYYNDGSFSDLIDCCDPVACDPICLSDNMFRYMGFSKALSEERGLTAAVENNRLPVDSVNNMLANQKFNKLNGIKGISRTAPVGDVDGDLLFENLFYQDEFVGRLMIKLSADADDYRIRYNKIILEHLYSYTIKLYGKYSSFNKNEICLNGLRILLQDRLDRKKIDEEQWKKSLEENGWEQGDRFQLIQVRPNLRYDKKMYAPYFSTEIESAWQGCVCFEHQNRFFVFINRDRFLSSEKLELKQALAYFLRESLLIAGMSRVFSDIDYIVPAYMQTEIALEYGVKRSPTFWYYNFNDYVEDYALGSCLGSFEAEHICSEKLLALREYDAKNNTEYCRTLLVYLQCRFNSTEAAKRLIIQRSSFNYRLERIKQLVNIDLDTCDEVFYLMLSFKILNIESQ